MLGCPRPDFPCSKCVANYLLKCIALAGGLVLLAVLLGNSQGRISDGYFGRGDPWGTDFEYQPNPKDFNNGRTALAYQNDNQ